jgi:putative nucleotidyltransferase with HDIG domain
LLTLVLFVAASVTMARDSLHSSRSYELAIFLAFILIAEMLPIQPPGTISEVTMTLPVILCLFISHGPWATIVLSTIGMLCAGFITHRKHYSTNKLLDMLVYNTSIFIISLAAASVAFVITLGRMHVEYGKLLPTEIYLPLLMWVLACTTVNALIFAVGLALYTSEPLRVLMIKNFTWAIPNYFITAPSGILFAYLYSQYGIKGVLLVVMPFVVGRQALNQYSLDRDTYLDTITTLGGYMQHYHPYTKGHLERVADLSDKIAKQIGLSAQSLRFIRDAGMLHDIGKVGVDEEVLDKVGKLSDEDWSVIKQHPARGAEILSRMKYFEPVVPWVRGHHERPDGKGYPDGLCDKDIPLEAAIIAVADAFDAMTGGPEKTDQRVYRTPLTLDQAMDQVRYGAGLQFDARVVRAFMRVMKTEGALNDG